MARPDTHGAQYVAESREVAAKLGSALFDADVNDPAPVLMWTCRCGTPKQFLDSRCAKCGSKKIRLKGVTRL